MRKWRVRAGIGALLALGVVSGLLTACGGTEGPTGGGGETPEPQLRVALVLPGSADDKGFNQAAYEALPILEQRFGAETAYSENTPVNEFEQAFRDYAEQGFDVVIGQGFEFGEVATKVAPDYPDTIFLVTNNPDVQGPNLQGLQPASWEAAYLAGVAAGTVSRSGKVGGIAGQEFPVIVAQMEAFKLGVLAVNPDADVRLTYLGTFEDVEKAKETARAMIDDGADVLYHIADAAGLGVIQAAQEAGIWAIGWGKDQNEVAPETVFTSQIVDQTAMIVDGVQAIVDGTFDGKPRTFGLDSDVLGLAPIRALPDDLASEVEAAVADAEAKILSGETEVPFIPEPTS
jgi:basic membrane protein A